MTALKLDNPDGYKNVEAREKAVIKWRGEFEQYAADIQHPNMKEDFRYLHGHQWSDEDVRKMTETDRPIVSFNRISALLDATYGAMVFNQMGISFVQRVATEDGSQISKHELLSSAAEYFRSLPHWNAEAEDRDMFRDMLACGVGCQEMIVDTEVTGEPEIIGRRVDPFSVGWDTRAKRVGLVDRRWHFHKVRLSEDEFKEEFGGLPESATPDASIMSETPGDKSEDPYEIHIFEWYESEKFHKIAELDDQTGDITKRDVLPSDIKGKTEVEDGFVFVPFGDRTPRRRRVYWRAHFHGDNMIRVRRVHCWSLTFAVGKRDDSDGSWYGMVRGCKDPQNWANKFLSLVIYIMATAGKGIMAEEDVFPPGSEPEKDWANPAKITTVSRGAIAEKRIAPKEQSALPPNLSDLLSYATSAVRDVSGVSLETIGAQINNQSGVVEESRKNAAMAVVAWAFSALRDFYRQQGYVLLRFMISYIPRGRLIRTMGASGQGQQFVQLDYEDATYEVEVDEVPNSPNKRAEVHRVLSAYAPILMQPDLPLQMRIQTIVETMRSSAVPDDIVRRIEAQAKQPPDPMAQQAQQVQLQTAMAQLEKLAAEVQEIRTQAGLNVAKAQDIGGQTQRKAIESAIDIQNNQDNAQLRLGAAAQMAATRIHEAQMKAATKAMSAEHDLAVKLATPQKDKADT